ncbi:MAG: hypothetical protein U0821_22495 [Chloroflexota bacterium]
MKPVIRLLRSFVAVALVVGLVQAPPTVRAGLTPDPEQADVDRINSSEQPGQGDPAEMLYAMPDQTAASGTFPDSVFNGMQITYRIAGATITTQEDTSGFTVSRAMKGTRGSGQLRVSGEARQGNGWGAGRGRVRIVQRAPHHTQERRPGPTGL